MKIRFDIKTVSEANQREHWATKNRRKKDQQYAFLMFWLKSRCADDLIPVGKLTVTFTRYSCKTLDQDNLAGAFKHVQDELARQLKVDDGDGSIRWIYAQEKIPTREHYFTVEFGGLE